MSRKFLISAIVGAACVVAAPAWAQTSGALAKAVGGYTFEDAAKEAPGTKDFHSKDGKLTFAIITHTAGNGFFDPAYVGAKLAADMVGVNLLDAGLRGAGRRHPARARDHQPGRSRIRPSTA